MFLMLVGVESRTYYKQLESFNHECNCKDYKWDWVTTQGPNDCQAWFDGVSLDGGWCTFAQTMSPMPPEPMLPEPMLPEPEMSPNPTRRSLHMTEEMCICKKTCQEGDYLVGNVCTSCTGVVVVGVSEDVCVAKDDLKAKYNEVECTRL